MIPNTLIRTVPTSTASQVEAWWREWCDLHPTWRHITYRDPLAPDMFPITSRHWGRCQSGAQLAGLVRLEALWLHGGHYLDSDMEPYRPLTSLSGLSAYAAYEDPGVIPDAVIGAEPEHPAIKACLDLAIQRITSQSTDWRTGNGAWATGPGVTTEIFSYRDDVTVLPPGSFFPAHYSAKATVDWVEVKRSNPWAFGAHRWAASWIGG